MSQNPNDGQNYNPYGQNPANPNYPPGTAYGGGPQPPSGPNPGYNPYPSSNPPSGPNPNGPNSSYGGQYGNPYEPYAPPPPQGTGPNPYDPYAQTAMSQNPISSPSYPNPVSNPGYPNPVSNPSYPAYNPQAGMMGTLPPSPVSTPPKRGRGLTVLISVIALIVVVGGLAFAGVAYNSNQNTLHLNGTATSVIQNANATATHIAQVQATASAIANTYPFSNKVLLNDLMVDNSQHVNWDNSQSTGCYFSGSAYHVAQNKSGFYNTCAAIGSNYSDFTFETEMIIKSGGDGANNTDAANGGLLFRADENNNKYYRLGVDTTGFYFILAIVDSTGTSGNARELKKGTASSFSTGLGSTNTLAIVARGGTYSFYVNQQLVTTFTDTTYTHGQIGFNAGYGTSATDVVFTNTKVWQL
ncbi:MAG: hypothetical protein ABI234_04090 [Ktedonobacteraceae bacterium]